MSPTATNNVASDYRIAAAEFADNPEQLAVYESTGNCVVLAGPGSGKTKTLTTKLARMLKEDIRPPSAIACLTYSTECVRELERRLARLRVWQGPMLFVGTVHSFCLKHVIYPFGHLSDLQLPLDIAVASVDEQGSQFAAAITAVLGNERPSDWRVRFDCYRRTFPDQNGKEFLTTDETLAALVLDYENRLEAAGLIDFDGMVLSALHILETHGWARQAVGAKFPILAVDEYQDLGLPLHRIVTCLCQQAGVRLLAVGDPDQSIYGFTGAKPELLAALAKAPWTKCVTLRFNYRSGQQIVTASEAALGERRDYRSKTSHAGTITFHRIPEGIDAQARKICSELLPAARARLGGCDLNQMAVLYVDKNDGDVIAREVARAGLPFIRIDRGAPYRRTELMRWIEDCAGWCAGGWSHGEPRLSILVSTWVRRQYSARNEKVQRQLRSNLVRFLFDHRDSTRLVSSWLGRFYAQCLIDPLNHEPSLRDEREAFNQLVKACGDDGPLRVSTIADFAGMGGTPEHLNLITLHSAKGLEFEAVFMMGMDQGKIPRWTVSTEEAKRESRRLFYVGLTRAKREIHLTYSGWYETRYGTRKEQGPSEFVVGLRAKLRDVTGD